MAGPGGAAGQRRVRGGLGGGGVGWGEMAAAPVPAPASAGTGVFEAPSLLAINAAVGEDTPVFHAKLSDWGGGGGC